MKVTCIIGSARNNGSTAYLIDSMIRGMQESNIEIARYCIGDADIHYCIGCKKCYTDGKCVQSDDVEKIVTDILSSDYVVIGSPSYWGDVPGQLKTFWDRNTPYGDTNPNRVLVAEKKIKGIGLSVRAGMTERENTVILGFIEHYFGHLGIEMVKQISVCNNDTLDDLKEKNSKYIEEMYELGRNLGML